MLGIIIQARLTSTRLPGKITQEIAHGRNSLEMVITTSKASGLPVVVAMPDDQAHKELSRTLHDEDVQYYFGSEENVLLRFVAGARAAGFTAVVRVCSDNPFLNLAYLNELVASWSDAWDYATWFTSSGIPAMKTHYGLFSEIARVSAMEEVLQKTSERHYLEHVTPWFYEHQELIRIRKLHMPAPFWTGVPIRLTLDTANDLRTIRRLAAETNPQDIRAVLEFCKNEEIAQDMKREIEANTK